MEKKQKLQRESKLSFLDQEEEEEENALQNKSSFKRRNFGKNPDVNTLFLSDKDRLQGEIKMKKELIENYIDTQIKAKELPLVTSYQYWDGSH